MENPGVCDEVFQGDREVADHHDHHHHLPRGHLRVNLGTRARERMHTGRPQAGEDAHLPQRQGAVDDDEPRCAGRARPRPQDRLHRPADLRCRDGEDLGAHLGLLRPRVAGAESRRLPRRHHRPPADVHGAPGRRHRCRCSTTAARIAACSWWATCKGNTGSALRLLLPRLELPPRRQGARDPAGAGLRRHAHDARQPRLQREARGARRQLSRLRLRQPRRRRAFVARVPRRGAASPSTTCATARRSARSRSCRSAIA